MKFVVLLERKNQLLERKAEILEQLEKAKQDMSQKDMQLFLQSGDMSQVNGADVAQLEKEQKHLEHLQKGLNVEITKVRKSERLKIISRLNGKIGELEQKRTGSLHDKYIHFLKKIEALKEIDRGVRAEITVKKSELSQINQNSLPVIFRLPNLKQALDENYFAHPDELEAMVKQAYKDNEKCLKADLGTPVEDRLVRGFQLTLDLDSGQLLKKEETTCGRDLAGRNPAVMAEVVK